MTLTLLPAPSARRAGTSGGRSQGVRLSTYSRLAAIQLATTGP